MNRTETIQTLNILNAAYPRAFSGLSAKEKQAQVEIWHFAFKDESAAIIINALREYVLTNKYPPTIAGLKEWTERFTAGPEDSALLSEAWHAVCGDIRFADLSEENKIFFGDQSRVDSYGLDPGTIQTVFAGQHKKAIGEIRKRVRAKKAVEQLPNLHVLEVGG